ANTGSPNSVDISPPAGLTFAQARTFRAGELVVGQSGCEACHEIGSNGNNGPGPNLTQIGALLPPAAIASTLRNPTPPMPSFKNLPPDKLNNLVYFLSNLQ
ncbi:MAG: cytochrome c, partial [Solirubrobacterales bacterium]|nr:cytochrome c [Solirubrobacterales bacterium]